MPGTQQEYDTMLYSHFLKYTTAAGLIFAFPFAQAAMPLPPL